MEFEKNLTNKFRGKLKNIDFEPNTTLILDIIIIFFKNSKQSLLPIHNACQPVKRLENLINSVREDFGQ